MNSMPEDGKYDQNM